ncbi:hypothetical protein BCR34DRAFT_604561 [Clohesyomyces aquaticus]|uniref:Uncharacterized protein n=1 Tax=Clohesyomyces aquaticus TaxID=1231657 RepID=A0A1Y1Z573_9PLEO|nr:hypothetical protein BCR34DRAFT_604561 [Clohesyomyces aquaticus]
MSRIQCAIASGSNIGLIKEELQMHRFMAASHRLRKVELDNNTSGNRQAGGNLHISSSSPPPIGHEAVEWSSGTQYSPAKAMAAKPTLGRGLPLSHCDLVHHPCLVEREGFNFPFSSGIRQRQRARTLLLNPKSHLLSGAPAAGTANSSTYATLLQQSILANNLRLLALYM